MVFILPPSVTVEIRANPCIVRNCIRGGGWAPASRKTRRPRPAAVGSEKSCTGLSHSPSSTVVDSERLGTSFSYVWRLSWRLALLSAVVNSKCSGTGISSVLRNVMHGTLWKWAVEMVVVLQSLEHNELENECLLGQSYHRGARQTSQAAFRATSNWQRPTWVLKFTLRDD